MMTQISKYSPVLFLLMWSSGAIFVKIGLQYASVSVFLAIRSVGATLALLLIWFLLRKLRKLEAAIFSSRTIIKVLLVGLVLQVGYQSAYFLALDYQLTPGILAIILGLQPILTPLLSGERIGGWGYAYLVLGLAGLALAVSGARELGALTSLGLIFGLLSSLAISVGTVMQKKLAVDPFQSAFYQSLVAAVIFLVAMPFTQVRLEVTTPFVLSALWMIVVVSTLALLLLFHLLSNNSASKVGVLFYMVPVITVFLDYLVFGNALSWISAVGGMLVVVAVREFSRDRSR